MVIISLEGGNGDVSLFAFVFVLLSTFSFSVAGCESGPLVRTFEEYPSLPVRVALI